MKTRVLTGVSVLVPVLYLVGWAPPWLFMAALAALVQGGLYEFFHISRAAGMKPYTALGYSAGVAICLAQWFDLQDGGRQALVAVVFLCLLILAVGVWHSKDLTTYSASVATTILGVFYVAFDLSCLFPLRFSSFGSAFASGRQLLFFLIAVIVAGDIFAYLTGRLAGRRFMFPTVSPNKTFESAVGGLAASVI